jgi:hypothetical protein
MLDAIRLYKQQVLGVTKKATLQEASDAFIKRQEHEQRNIRTVYSDRQALRDKLIRALGAETPMTELTLEWSFWERGTSHTFKAPPSPLRESWSNYRLRRTRVSSPRDDHHVSKVLRLSRHAPLAT